MADSDQFKRRSGVRYCIDDLSPTWILMTLIALGLVYSRDTEKPEKLTRDETCFTCSKSTTRNRAGDYVQMMENWE